MARPPVACFRRVAALLAGLVLLPAALALGQAPDPVADQLALARRTYEDTLESLRDRVREAIERERSAILKMPGDNAARVAELIAARRAFEATGRLPDGQVFAAIEQAYARAAAAMSNAYGKAQLSYDQAQATDAVDAVSAERDRFARQCDLVPWVDRMPATQPATLTVSPASPLDLDLGISGPYRLEVVGSQPAGGGALRVGVPIGNGRRVEVEVQGAPRGALRLLLTVDAAAISADLGTARPVDLSSAAPGPQNAVTLRAVGEPVTIERVRVKPLVSAPPPDPAKRAVQDAGPGSATPATPSARLVRGSVWEGPGDLELGRPGSEQVTGTIIERDGDSATLRIPAFAGKGHLLLSLEIQGDQLTVTGIRHVGRGIDRQFIDVTGAGTIQGDALAIRCSFRVHTAETRNQANRIALNLRNK